LTDTTDLLHDGASAPDAQDVSTSAGTPAARTRRRATSGGLAALVLPELQAMAGELGISGVGRLRKSQLIEAISARQSAGNAAPTAPPTAGTTGDEPTPAPARTARTARTAGRSSRAAGATAGVESSAPEAPGVGPDADRQPDRQPDGEPDSGAERGSGPAASDGPPDTDSGERIDRGRERFLEREARRQERQAAFGSGDGSGQADADRDSRERPARTDRGDRLDRLERQDRADRFDGSDRPSARQDSRTDGRPDVARTDAPGRQEASPRGENGGRDDEEFGPGGRRGRFRERGRGRNRNRTGVGSDRFGSDPEPMVNDDDVLIPVGGILDILDNYGFVRTTGYLTGPNDVYVSLQQVRKYGLRRGDAVTGAVRQQREGERKDKYNALVRLDSVNGMDPAEAHKRPDFTKLTPLYPQDRLRLETEPGLLTTRVIDLVMPVGKGQRALIVSPPKAGKTMVMQAIANAITHNNPECHLMVVLVDERPEEVTDMQRSVKGEVIASTFDRPPQDHITVAELSIERAKRLVELGHDVVVLLDSITRLGRAYNLGAPASGRILTGGVDSAALYPPKRFLGAARNIENGGSLTIFATALVETGSAMDTVIFEEFKGTGNAELKLDRRLADKRIFPAIDVDASGTRKEEILLSPEELRIVLQLRRVLHALDTTASLELLLGKMKSTRTNVEFLMQIQKTTVESD